jgi:hypothetical protein
MKLLSLSILACAILTTSAADAAKSRSDEMLKLTPETRLEQRCNGRAMGAVSREHKGFR